MTLKDPVKSNSAVDTPAKAPPRKKLRWGFRLAAVGIGLLPFVVLEVALRAVDVAKPTGYKDPYVGFSKLHPQFEKNEDRNVYETTLSRRMFFGKQDFAIDKPKDGLRVFCLGGSTVRGRPYTVDTAFARWMQLELAATDPDHTYEIINCGGLSYASYRLAAMLEEVLKYEPDAIVLATGHNEFLEDRTYKAIKEQSKSKRWLGEKLNSLRTVTAARKIWDDWGKEPDEPKTDDRQQLKVVLKTKLDEESGYASYNRKHIDHWRKGIETHFNIAVRGMVKLCEEAGVPLILVRLGSNLRDCPPFKSEFDPNLGKDGAVKEKMFWAAMDFATDLERNELLSNPDDFIIKKAMEAYTEAEDVDPKHALLCYRLARLHDRMGNYEEATSYYWKAKDYDICPLRMSESMSKTFETIAGETNTPMVDARKLLEDASPQGLPGSNFYMDHVHPTIGGHQRIARAIVACLRTEKIVAAPIAEWTDRQRRTAYHDHIGTLGIGFFGEASERVSWLEGWAQRERMLEETQPNDLRGYVDNAGRLTDLGNEDAGWAEHVKTLKGNQDSPPLIMQQSLGFFRQGRFQTATKLLTRLAAALKEEPRIEAHFALAVIALETGDIEEAKSLFTKHCKSFGDLPVDAAWLQAFPQALEKLGEL